MKSTFFLVQASVGINGLDSWVCNLMLMSASYVNVIECSILHVIWRHGCAENVGYVGQCSGATVDRCGWCDWKWAAVGVRMAY